MLTVQGFFVLTLTAVVCTSEEKEVTSLPDAVRLLQLRTINHLRQTNKEQESVISEKESQIAKLEVENAEKDGTIGNLTSTAFQLRQDTLNKELEKEQCDNMSQTKDEAIVEHLAKIAELEMEKRDQLLLLANKTEEIAQLKGDFKAKMKEKKKQCEAEKTHLNETFAFKSLEEEENCKKEKQETESQHILESEKISTKLKQRISFISFMSDVMLHDNLMRAKVQNLTESQALQIKEANENLKRQMDAYLTCESVANTTAVQIETISMLRTSLANALAFQHPNMSGLEKHESIASFMLELMGSYNEQTRRIEDLKVILEKAEDVEDQAIELAEKLTNLTLALRSAASVNLDIMEEQAEVIQSQGESLAKLTPLLRYTHEDVVWRQKTEGTGVVSVSTCSCLPRSIDLSRPAPEKIEYQCGEASNRSFNFQCQDGVCKSDGLPSCAEPVEWEETDVTLSQQCQETVFKDNVVLCGKNGTKSLTKRSYTSDGMIEEKEVTPCLDCTDLLTWTVWGPCNSSTNTSEGAKCRHRGNDELGFEEEKKVDCVMVGWSDWSGCSQTCGDGIIARSREVVEQPFNGGLACSDLNETRKCNIEPCAVEMLVRKQTGNPIAFFDKTFRQYQDGFSSKGESWIGLDNLHRLTSQRSFSLKIIMTDYDGKSFVAVYDQFKVGQGPGYVLRVGGFDNALSTLGDSFRYNNGMMFSAKDRDRDERWFMHCAIQYVGGWWYNECPDYAHPTGLSSATKIYGSSYVNYYHGGERGRGWSNWAEAEYLLVPKRA